MKITKDQILNTIGIIIIIISLLRLYMIVTESTILNIFWLCNHIPLIIGISILFRSSYILIAETSLLLIGSAAWILDFFSKLLFDKYLLGFTTYIFEGSSVALSVSTISHLTILPLAITAIFLIGKPEPKAWHFSIYHSMIIFVISFLVGTTYNLNCFFRTCISWLPNFQFYTLISFTIYLTIFVIPVSILFTKLLSKRKS